MRSKARLELVGMFVVLGLGCTSAANDDGMNGVTSPVGGNGGTVGGTMSGPTGGVGGSSATGGVGGSAGIGVPSGGIGGGVGGSAGTTVAGTGGVGGMIVDAGDIDPDASVDPGFARLPKATSTDGPGTFTEVTKVKDTPPGGWLIYPTKLGEGGMKHPIFIFGPGGGTTPMTYETSGMHWDRYASYGFVIYVLPQSTGDGAAMKAGLDWVIEQNDVSSSPLYQKLDTGKVCTAGHSQGSVTTFDFMPDDRVTTTIHISGGSFDGLGPSHLTKDTMFMCAPDSSGDPAKPQCDGDFENSTVPTFYTVVQGADHLTSARLGWSATIAWMLWHLAGHDEWRAEFLEPGGEFQSGIFMSQIKNW